MHADIEDAALHAAFVSVFAGPTPVGAGVLIAEDLVLTCAHVVNSALGRDRFDQSSPPRAARLTLTFPLVDHAHPVSARVEPASWRAPRAEAVGLAPVLPGRLAYYGDLAVLRLEGGAPAGAEPAPFQLHDCEREVVALWASGHPLTATRARPRVVAASWLALDVVGGAGVTEGYSGGPLWDRARQAVVGLVVAVHEEPSALRVRAGAYPDRAPAVLYGISLPAVESELPRLPPLRGPAARRGVQQLTAALEDVLVPPTSVADCERRLAARLGFPAREAGADHARLVRLAVGTRRGVPELLEAVRGTLDQYPTPREGAAGALARLRRAARVVSPAECLTLAQRRELTELLARCRPPAPEALLAAVVPYDAEPRALSGLADVIDVLETYEPTEAQPTPPLLQAVVLVARQEREGADSPAADLRAWAKRVAARLGVEWAAVCQFEADTAHRPPLTAPPLPASPPRDTERGHQRAAVGAAGRVGREGTVPRVQVELLPTGGGTLFTYQIWAWDAGAQPRLVVVQDHDASSSRVVDDIRRVLRTEVREDPETALVEFFLAPEWLGLAVDTWESDEGDEGGAFVPGLTRRLVVRTTSRTRECYAGWKRRTASLTTTERLVFDDRHADHKVARANLEVRPDVGTVVLCCDPVRHGQLLRQCVQAGVHTVLWHRADHGAQVGMDLANVLEGTEPRGVPEAVRLERAKAVAEPGVSTHRGGQLSLLHDPPDHRPPPLAPEPWVLAEPSP
ncbi:trypsin-like peptidase domain-containing protein [Streptomyces sp. NPDC057702]|uniref:VMAP-C domain-containing protein n=1 Tax=unclassified Streptomyces TaxID=2593676 RepID=UPI00368A1557